MGGRAGRARRLTLFALVVPVVALAGCTAVVAGTAVPGPAPITTTSATSATSARTSITVAPTSTSGRRSTTVHTSPGPTPSTTTSSTPPTTIVTTTTTTTTTPPLDASHVDVADRLATTALDGLAADLQSGNRTHFLAGFAEKLQTEVGDWFTNTRALGVSATRFTPVPEASSQTRTTVVRDFMAGIRTPFDNAGTMPALRYRITLTKTGSTWQVTAFAPSEMSDPMYCVCHMIVDKRANLAVVHRSDPVLDAWPQVVLARATESSAWDAKNMTTKGLQQPTGHVIFLADQAYKWFLPTSEPAQENNSTIPLPAGDLTYSPVSRIVVMLQDSAGHELAPNADAILYVWDVLTHEMVHQFFFLNTIPELHGQFPDAPSWVAEGIAVAAETLHRRQHEQIGDGDFVFPLDDDIANVSDSWLTKHLAEAPPSADDLYSGDVTTADNWYAVAGSVFLWIADRSGNAAMISSAEAAFDAQDSVFDHVKGLTATNAEKAWRAWIKQKYLS